MIINDLVEMDYIEQKIYPNIKIINTIWVVLFWIVNIASFIVLALLRKDMDPYDKTDPLRRINEFIFDALNTFGLGYFIFVLYFVLLLFIYFAVKCMMTILFCEDKNSISKEKGSIKFLFLKSYTRMPVCFCREALKAWQNTLIYFVPFALVYTLMFFLVYKAGYGYMPLLFILLFVMTFDLLPVIYVLYAKSKYGMDYISMDQHVYEMTLFSENVLKNVNLRN